MIKHPLFVSWLSIKYFIIKWSSITGSWGLQKTLTVHFWLECSFSRIMQLLCKVCSIKKSTVQENRCLPCSPRALGFHPKFLEGPLNSYCYLESLFGFEQCSQSWKCWCVSSHLILTRPWEFTSSLTAALLKKIFILFPSFLSSSES